MCNSNTVLQLSLRYYGCLYGIIVVFTVLWLSLRYHECLCQTTISFTKILIVIAEQWLPIVTPSTCDFSYRGEIFSAGMWLSLLKCDRLDRWLIVSANKLIVSANKLIVSAYKLIVSAYKLIVTVRQWLSAKITDCLCWRVIVSADQWLSLLISDCLCWSVIVSADQWLQKRIYNFKRTHPSMNIIAS